MTIKPFPTLKTHTLTTPQATELIDWHCVPTKVFQYPLPTEMVLTPGQDVNIRVGLIWPSKSGEGYWVAQVYSNVGQDGHTLYALYGWLHITTDDLALYIVYIKSMYISLHGLYYKLEHNLEERVPSNN